MTFKDLLAMKESPSTGDSWYAIGIVRYRISMRTTGVWLRGDIRVGFEYNVYREKGSWQRATQGWLKKWGGLSGGRGLKS